MFLVEKRKMLFRVYTKVQVHAVMYKSCQYKKSYTALRTVPYIHLASETVLIVCHFLYTLAEELLVLELVVVGRSLGACSDNGEVC